MGEFVLTIPDAKVVGGKLKSKLTYNFARKLKVDYLKDGLR